MKQSSHVSRKKNNNQLAIGLLPPKVLSHIMFLGVQSDQRAWRWEPRNIGSQQIASHVCRHWRDVALNTQNLWTFIHVGASIPNEHTALYLARAGPTELLDVAIDLSSPSPLYDPTDRENHDRIFNSSQGDSEKLSKNLKGILELFTTHGAEPSRWRSLLVRTEELGGQELSSLIECIGQHPVPNLQRLYLGHYRTTFTRMLIGDKIGYLTCNITDDARTFIESLSSSLLCLELELSCVYSYTFGSTCAFAKLKTLTIVSYKLGHFQLREIFSASPQLESLCLSDDDEPRSTRNVNRPTLATDPEIFPLASPRIAAPSLRSLSIHTEHRPARARQILAAIEATKLHSFSLKCTPKHLDEPHTLSLVAYIIGKPEDPTNTSSSGRPIFPSLQSLDISLFGCTKQQTQDLVSSFPELTRLVVGKQQLAWLGETFFLKLPRLETLGVLGLPARAKAVTDFLSHRAFASNPIKEVEARASRLTLSSKTQHKRRGLIPGLLSAAPTYEYYQCEDDTITSDLQSLERRSALTVTMLHPCPPVTILLDMLNSSDNLKRPHPNIG
ncbi:unnamed protein product [Rhizoctonia solani]|uniref:F-box domain-containing protein n=1 Tax=Rhizoctonia solani TaxID=456999 RepID=A0A8H3DTC2_9AGAM|nr:unnamed protein product [Rhizoctonia solani]